MLGDEVDAVEGRQHAVDARKVCLLEALGQAGKAAVAVVNSSLHGVGVVGADRWNEEGLAQHEQVIELVPGVLQRLPRLQAGQDVAMLLGACVLERDADAVGPANGLVDDGERALAAGALEVVLVHVLRIARAAAILRWPRPILYRGCGRCRRESHQTGAHSE